MNSYKSKRDLVVEAIRDAILRGDFEPGDRVPQEELAVRLNVSATPVREALRQLEAEGALEYSPHRGTRVTETAPETAVELSRIRAELESLAARAAVPNLRAADLLAIRALHAEFQAHLDRGEFKELRRPNYEMHMRLYRAAGMPELFKIIQLLWTKFPWDTLHVLPNRAYQAAAEHGRLLEAIEQRDAERAGQLVREHIESGMTALIAFLNDNQPSSA